MTTIPVVDDDPDIRNLLTDLLAPDGHRAHPTAWLPELNGLELVPCLRARAPGHLTETGRRTTDAQD